MTYNLTGTLDGLTLLDETIGTEQHNTDLAGLEVHAHSLDTGGYRSLNHSKETHGKPALANSVARHY